MVNRRSEVDVHPEHRGRGLGSALLAWAEARATDPVHGLGLGTLRAGPWTRRSPGPTSTGWTTFRRTRAWRAPEQQDPDHTRTRRPLSVSFEDVLAGQ